MTIRVATFNVENLFARFKFGFGIDPQKASRDGWNVDETVFHPLSMTEKAITAAAIADLDADVLCLQEVENIDTLKHFRARSLGGRDAYPYVAGVDGNDPRLIDVAVLSRLPIVHIRSYQHVRDPQSPAREVFSRDCLEVDVAWPGPGQVLTLFVQHFKSMMGGRANTAPRRHAQARAVKQIVRDRFGEHAGEHPFIVCGDFNDYMQTDDQGEPPSASSSSGTRSTTSSTGSLRPIGGPTTSKAAGTTPSWTTCCCHAAWPAPTRVCRRSCARACRCAPTGTPANASTASAATTPRPPTIAPSSSPWTIPADPRSPGSTG
jgi:endonuclease/exonuclease/phosphatase family metal-dependent hydrolase